MICDRDTLDRALTAYRSYLPTASEHLRESRERHIPVVLTDEQAGPVMRHAQSVADGEPHAHSYASLSEAERVGAALLLTHAWALRMLALLEAGATREAEYTQRVFEYLAGIPLDHATLAVRNWGSGRDGGVAPPMRILCGLRITSVPSVMEVYLRIRARWQERGYDWKRREAEEAAMSPG